MKTNLISVLKQIQLENQEKVKSMVKIIILLSAKKWNYVLMKVILLRLLNFPVIYMVQGKLFEWLND